LRHNEEDFLSSFVSITSLASGERVGLGAIEITSVPHVSILQNRAAANVAGIDSAYKQDMARLLSGVFQNCKNAAGACKDVSVELLFVTRAVNNQPYKAAVSLYIIVRAIGSADTEINETIGPIIRICKAALDFGKYEYRETGYAELAPRIRLVNDRSVRAIVKTERLEQLQNALVPYCFAYDRIPVTENDMSRLVNSLIEYPDCAVSFQLIPVTLSAEESNAIDHNAQTLGTLSKGVMEQGVGNISFTLAEKHAETYKYYSHNKNTALFACNALV
jgi:hypothetical protein